MHVRSMIWCNKWDHMHQHTHTHYVYIACRFACDWIQLVSLPSMNIRITYKIWNGVTSKGWSIDHAVQNSFLKTNKINFFYKRFSVATFRNMTHIERQVIQTVFPILTQFGWILLNYEFFLVLSRQKLLINIASLIIFILIKLKIVNETTNRFKCLKKKKQ